MLVYHQHRARVHTHIHTVTMTNVNLLSSIAPSRPAPLSMAQDTEMFSRGFCVWLAAGYIVGAMPYCLMALILKYSYISYSAARHLTSLMGCVLFWRAWLGPDWVVKSGYLLQWLFTVDMYRRDDIGNALTAGA